MNAIALVAVTLLAGSPEAAPSDEAARKARAETAAVIRDAVAVEISLVEVQLERGPNGPVPKEVVRGPVRKLDTKDAEYLRTLASQVLSSENAGSMCAFNTDLKVTFTKGDQTRVAEFCFSCGDAMVFNGAGVRVRAKRAGFFEEKEKLKALIDRVYADLPAEDRAVGRNGY